MPRKGSPYGKRYEAVRAAMLGQPCQMRLVCDGDPANSLDHEPPLSRHHHIEGSGCCLLRPACMRCQTKQAYTLAGQTAKFKKLGLPPPSIDVYQPSRVWL
jgi:hypothetical protein